MRIVLIPRFLVLVSLIFNATLTYAQFTRSASLELSCVHLHPVQIKYLEKHVNYTKLAKNLESRTTEQFVKRLDGSKLYLLEKDVKDIDKMLINVFDKSSDHPFESSGPALDIG